MSLVSTHPRNLPMPPQQGGNLGAMMTQHLHATPAMKATANHATPLIPPQPQLQALASMLGAAGTMPNAPMQPGAAIPQRGLPAGTAAGLGALFNR